FGHSLWSANQLPAQEVNLNVENFLSQNYNISSVLNMTQTKQIIDLLLLSNNFYPMISYRFKKKKVNYCTRFGHSLWSANQLPAQGVKMTPLLKTE
ncbi:unnamed protein product, partial [Heterotrigona itama]